ncbi:DUF167 domain-containing protein [Desulfomarina sp.]
MSFLVKAKGGSLLLRLHIQPRASRTKIIGIYDGTLKMTVCAPPVEGRANREIVKFLAKKLKITRSDVRVKSGMQSRRKSVELKNILESEVRRLLEAEE